MEEVSGDQFGNAKQLFVRFFYKGQFLAFFAQPEPKNVPLYYVKT